MATAWASDTLVSAWVTLADGLAWCFFCKRLTKKCDSRPSQTENKTGGNDKHPNKSVPCETLLPNVSGGAKRIFRDARPATAAGYGGHQGSRADRKHVDKVLTDQHRQPGKDPLSVELKLVLVVMLSSARGAYRHHPNCSLVLRYEHTVLGGVTFRLIRDKAGSDGGSVMLEVLIAAVEQRPGVCGRGHGTRLTNVLKALLARRAREFEACPLLLTQADLGLHARMFWLRQQLKESEEARRAVCDLHAWQERNIV